MAITSHNRDAVWMKVNRKRSSFCKIQKSLLSTQYFWRTQLKPMGNILIVEESDPKVYCFYLRHLTGTKKEMAWIWDYEREMTLPSLYSRSVGVNYALNKRTAFLQAETRTSGANNVFTFDQNGFYNNMQIIPKIFWFKKWLHVTGAFSSALRTIR